MYSVIFATDIILKKTIEDCKFKWRLLAMQRYFNACSRMRSESKCNRFLR
jgi:hypothetical protein